MEQDGCGCTVPKSSPIPPRLPGAPAAAEKALFVLPHPPGRGREMPSAVNHPALLPAHPSPAGAPGPGAALAAPCQALSRQWHRGTRGNVLPQPPNLPTAGSASPNPAQPSSAPPRGIAQHGMFSQDSAWGYPREFRGAPGVLTGAVLVPGMAADGLQQEAVVGHGSWAGDRETPPGCQDMLLQPKGQDPNPTE